ncbi:MAG: hypothetical protein ACTSSH_12410, partial [Candidatus Heimdallarchaeota archaeon]
NSTKTFSRQSDALIETHILSPVLSNGSFLDSANYNVTIVAITNTDEKSDLLQWTGGYVFIDTGIPELTFINPSIALEDVWGLYDVTVEVLDTSNLSKIEYYIDSDLRFTLNDPLYSQTIFKWRWTCSEDDVGQHTIKVRALDNSPALNVEEKAFTVEVVGPSIKYNEPIPLTIDSNDTLLLNATITNESTVAANISSVIMHHAYDDVWQNTTLLGTGYDNFNLTFAFDQKPVGSKISFVVIVNNSLGEYNVFLNSTLDPFVVYSVYPDHIDPIGEVDFDPQLTIYDQIIISANITEQSPISSCLLNYQLDDGDWEEIAMVQTQTGVNDSWFFFEYEFLDAIPIFTIIQFNIWLNDSGNNILYLNNKGNDYLIRIIPHDLDAPEVLIITKPEELNAQMNVTITAEVNETSAIDNVELLYTVNGIQFSVEMTLVSNNTWSASFILTASTGDKIQIWVQAMDEYYNTGISAVEAYDVLSAKGGVAHSNFLIWLMFLVLIFLPIIMTLLILRPQR